MISGKLSNRPLRDLVFLFLCWKTILGLIAISAPGPGYDTSTSLLFSDSNSNSELIADSVTGTEQIWRNSISRLVRWDAIYFASAAHRGYIFEQEWAFSWGFTRLIYHLTIFRTASPSLTDTALTGILVANAAHLLSVILLYVLCNYITPRANGSMNAFIPAALHIIAPAGLFLSAPYSESTFSATSFLGYLLYAHGLKERKAINDLSVIIAGLTFGIAATVRSNGVLNGVMFAFDLAVNIAYFRDKKHLRHSSSLVVGGSFIAAGVVAPQVIAYREYCMPGISTPLRPWCDSFPPSIYTFVQKHYWNNGFLQYWTVSNLPLFLLAAPMLTLMMASAVSAINSSLQSRRNEDKTVNKAERRQDNADTATDFRRACLLRFALPQLILTLLAITNSHVQIITRLASGYVLPYLWITDAMAERRHLRMLGADVNIAAWTVRWMVIYGFVQGGLFASFLPPA